MKFSLVTKAICIRVILSIANTMNMEIHQMHAFQPLKPKNREISKIYLEKPGDSGHRDEYFLHWQTPGGGESTVESKTQSHRQNF